MISFDLCLAFLILCFFCLAGNTHQLSPGYREKVRPCPSGSGSHPPPSLRGSSQVRLPWKEEDADSRATQPGNATQSVKV
jgi:hypothetical protein